MSLFRFPLIGFALSIAVAAPTMILAQAADITVNMHDVELADVAEQISRLTGRTLILDPNVKGTVNVVSAEPLSAAGVWDLFQSVLRVHGFAAIRSGRVWRIVPQAAAVQGVPTSGGAAQVITSMIRLRNLPSDVAARALKPLVASFGSLEAIPSPNAIVVTDYADNVRRIEALARSLDTGGGNEVASIPLRYGSAKSLAAPLQSLLGEQGAGGARVAADERSNALLIRGDARAVADARRLAQGLDRPGATAPVTRLIRLRNADAESLVDVLRGVMGAQESASVTNPVARSLQPAGEQATPGTGAIGQVSSTGAIGGGSSFGSGLGGSSSSGFGAASSSPYGGGGIGPSSLPGASGGAAASGSQQQTLNNGFSTPDLTVQAASDLNAIILRGTPTAVAAAEPLITDLDLRRPQVMIEAAIVEVTSDVGDQLGIQLGGGNAAAISPSGVATSFTDQGVPLQGILAALGAPVAAGLLAQGGSAVIKPSSDFSILIQALSTSTKANLLSTPSITTLDNQPASIVVGQNVPFVTGQYTSTGTSATVAPFETIERQDVGIILKVIPRIHEGNVIRLDVSQEVSSLVGTVTDASDIVTNTRNIQTTVLADDGQTIVLGGLVSDDRMTTRSAIPILGDIPVLGVFFRNKKEEQTKRTLFVFLKPTILRDPSAAADAAQRKYDRLRYDEYNLQKTQSLLLNPPRPRLTTEISGVY